MSPEMYHGMNLQMAQRQEMVMTPQMIQSMEMLQMPLLELEQKIQKELIENPALELQDLKSETASSEDSEDNYDVSDNELEIEKDGEAVNDFNDLRYADEVDYNWNEIYDDILPRRNFDDEEFDIIANTESHEDSLIESLLKQLHLLDINERQKDIAEIIISSLDESGYFSLSFAEIDFSDIVPEPQLEEFEDALDEVQHLYPPGIAARDLKESLLLQLDTIDDPANLLASEIVENHLEDLAANKLPLIAKSLKSDIEEVKIAVSLIKNLHPYPVTGYHVQGAEAARADIIVELVESTPEAKRKAKEKVFTAQRYLEEMEHNNFDEKTDYIVRAARSSLHDAQIELDLFEADGTVWELRLPTGPTPEVSDTFLALYDNTGRGEIVRQAIMNDPERKEEFLALQKSLKSSGQNKIFRERFQSAFDIVKAVQQRELTLTRVVREIVVRQKEYLSGVIPAPAPLMMKEVAELLDIDIGTVSRAARDKFAQTPIGLKPLRNFFTRSVPANTAKFVVGNDGFERVKNPEGGFSNIQIRNRVKEIIDSEDKKKPYKDDQIQVMLEKEGIVIKRRTVAKHRLKLGYKNYSQRREY